MERERGLVSEFEKLLRRGCNTGEFKIDDVPLVANNIVITGHKWALRRWMLGKICTLDEYIHSQTGYILKTISANHKK